MGKALNHKGVNLEEIKEKLKRALGIKRDETLLYFAMLGPLRARRIVTRVAFRRLNRQAEEGGRGPGETLESITEKGLIGLAKYYGTIRWTQFPEPFFLFGSPKKIR
jgi:hypothetical protein